MSVIGAPAFHAKSRQAIIAQLPADAKTDAAQRTFAEWTKKPDRRTADLLEKLNSAFFTLLDGLTIARSRKHVERYYKESVSQLGGFPVRLKPLSIYPQIDLHSRFMSYDRLNTEISAYQLSLFSPSK